MTLPFSGPRQAALQVERAKAFCKEAGGDAVIIIVVNRLDGKTYAGGVSHGVTKDLQKQALVALTKICDQIDAGQRFRENEV